MAGAARAGGARGCSCRLEPDVESRGHAAERGERGFERLPACGRHAEAARASSAALWGGVTFVRAHEALVLEARQRLVDGAEREVALCEPDDLVVDGHAVRIVADAKHREKDDLFELAEHWASIW